MLLEQTSPSAPYHAALLGGVLDLARYAAHMTSTEATRGRRGHPDRGGRLIRHGPRSRRGPSGAEGSPESCTQPASKGKRGNENRNGLQHAELVRSGLLLMATGVPPRDSSTTRTQRGRAASPIKFKHNTNTASSPALLQKCFPTCPCCFLFLQPAHCGRMSN